MAKFVFFLKARSEADPWRADDWKDALIVRKGFNGKAFIFGPLWLAFQKLWLALAVYLIACICAAMIALANQLWPLALLILCAYQLWLGFNAYHLERARLADHGYFHASVVEAYDMAEAVGSFKENWVGNLPTLEKIEKPNFLTPSNMLFHFIEFWK